MSFDEVAEFHPDWSFERRAVAYGLFGGGAGLCRARSRVHESPGRGRRMPLALSPAGPLYAEPEFLVREELRDSGRLLRHPARAGGGEDPPEREIAQDAEDRPTPALASISNTLRRLRLVRRETPVTEARPERSRRRPVPPGRPVPALLVPVCLPQPLRPGGRPEPAGARVGRAPRPGHVHGPALRGHLPPAPDRQLATAARLAAAAGWSLLGRAERDRFWWPSTRPANAPRSSSASGEGASTVPHVVRRLRREGALRRSVRVPRRTASWSSAEPTPTTSTHVRLA